MEGCEEDTQTDPETRELEGANRALALLSPSSRSLILTMLGQLAEREGIDMETAAKPGVGTPAAGLALWEAKLTQEGKSPRTIETYLSTLTRFLADYPTPSRLDIQSWLAKQMETCASSTVSTHKKALRSLFGFLHEEGLWPTNPTARLGGIKVTYEAKDPPTVEEVKTLLTYRCRRDKDTKRYRLMTLILATTALRITEAASIRKDRIYLDEHELRVMGKGSKERVVPLVAAAEAELRLYLAERPNGSKYLFPGATKTGYWDISAYEKTFKRACARLGLSDKYTPHFLRHFYATFLLRQGAQLEIVSEILGHASIGITGDLYSHVMTKEKHKTVAKFAPLQDTPRLAAGEPPEVEGEFREVPANE